MSTNDCVALFVTQGNYTIDKTHQDLTLSFEKLNNAPKEDFLSYFLDLLKQID